MKLTQTSLACLALVAGCSAASGWGWAAPVASRPAIEALAVAPHILIHRAQALTPMSSQPEAWRLERRRRFELARQQAIEGRLERERSDRQQAEIAQQRRQAEEERIRTALLDEQRRRA